MGIDYAKPEEFVFAVIESLPQGKEDGALTVREALVLSYIGIRANRYGTCYPGSATIARATRTSKSSISKTLNKFERMGIIRRETKQKAGGGRRPDTIVLELKKAQQGEPTNNDQGEPTAAARWTFDVQQGEPTNPGTNKGKGQQGKDNRKKAIVVDKEVVPQEVLDVAAAAIGAFNERSGLTLKLVTDGGKPTEALKRVVMRLRETPKTADEVAAIVHRNFDNPWWTAEPGIGVIFGPKAWERAMANTGVRRNRSGRKTRLDIDRPITKEEMENEPW